MSDTHKLILQGLRALGPSNPTGVSEADLHAWIEQECPGTRGVLDALMDLEAVEEVEEMSGYRWRINAARQGGAA